MTAHLLGDTAALTGRSLRHVLRSPDTIITTAVMPIAFLLLFVFVLGGAIRTGSDSYVDYLLPGILLITVASGISYTAYRLFLDVRSGIFERFRSMPIARSAVLWAHVLTSLVANAISLVVVVLVALLVGFRSSAGPLAWLAVAPYDLGAVCVCSAASKAEVLAPRQSTTFKTPASRASAATRGLGTNSGKARIAGHCSPANWCKC